MSTHIHVYQHHRRAGKTFARDESRSAELIRRKDLVAKLEKEVGGNSKHPSWPKLEAARLELKKLRGEMEIRSRDSSPDQLLARAKATYESALRRASDPAARAQAKEDYEATVKSIKKTHDADGVRTIYKPLLGAWYNVRGPHQTPIGGSHPTQEAAKAALIAAKNRRDGNVQKDSNKPDPKGSLNWALNVAEEFFAEKKSEGALHAYLKKTGTVPGYTTMAIQSFRSLMRKRGGDADMPEAHLARFPWLKKILNGETVTSTAGSSGLNEIASQLKGAGFQAGLLTRKRDGTDERKFYGNGVNVKAVLSGGKITLTKDAAQKGWLQIVDAPLSAQRAGKNYEWRLKSGPSSGDIVDRGTAETWEKAKAAGVQQAQRQGFSTQFNDAIIPKTLEDAKRTLAKSEESLRHMDPKYYAELIADTKRWNETLRKLIADWPNRQAHMKAYRSVGDAPCACADCVKKARDARGRSKDASEYQLVYPGGRADKLDSWEKVISTARAFMVAEMAKPRGGHTVMTVYTIRPDGSKSEGQQLRSIHLLR